MTVETRVIIDANASNAIREIGKLDDAAADADKTIGKLDDAAVNVDTGSSAADIQFIEAVAADAKAKLDTLDAQKVAVAVDIDVDADRLDTVKRKLDDVDSSGRAGSTAIGGIGNSISELPGVGALGPMAESMGQLAEGALEGEINVGQLVGTAGGLAAVAIVAQKVGDHFAKLAAVKAWRRAEVDAYTESMREADTVLDGIIDKLETDGSIGAMLFGDDETDITGKVAAVGLTVEQFARLVDSGETKIREWGDAMKAAGVDADAVDLVMLSAAQNAEALGDAQAGAAAYAKVFGKETDNTTDALVKAAQAAADHAVELGKAAGKTAELEAANRKLRGDLNNREAYLNIQQSFDDLAAAGQQAMTDVATGAVDAETATRQFELQQIAAKDAVLAYVDEIGNIPPDKQTEILALIDQGKFDEAETALTELTKPREMEIRFKFDSSKLNAALAAGTVRPPTTRLNGVRD